jgi:hypothetical protein
MRQEPSPLEMIFSDIERALKARLYYVAIAVSLSIPDICAALELFPADKRVTRKNYIAWFKENLSSEFQVFTAEDCYRLRCGVLHKARSSHPELSYHRIALMLPTPGGYTIHEADAGYNGGSEERILTMHPEIFCHRVIAGARRWLAAKRDDQNVMANLPNVVRLRPEGLPPNFSGMPLIA